jgi:NAD(P)-dependent dehydrogenase (short-subunit alcohol dehydrogenase family)
MMDSEAQDRRRAAVFGATGGIGGALVRRLSARGWEVAAGARRPFEIAGASAVFAFDLADEDSIAAAASMLRAKPPECVIVATGALTLPDGKGPEKSFRQIDAAAMAEAFRLNTIGPALIAKHMLPLLSRERRSVFAVLGARVGGTPTARARPRSPCWSAISPSSWRAPTPKRSSSACIRVPCEPALVRRSCAGRTGPGPWNRRPRPSGSSR